MQFYGFKHSAVEENIALRRLLLRKKRFMRDLARDQLETLFNEDGECPEDNPNELVLVGDPSLYCALTHSCFRAKGGIRTFRAPDLRCGRRKTLFQSQGSRRPLSREVLSHHLLNFGIDSDNGKIPRTTDVDSRD